MSVSDAVGVGVAGLLGVADDEAWPDMSKGRLKSTKELDATDFYGGGTKTVRNLELSSEQAVSQDNALAVRGEEKALHKKRSYSFSS